MQNNLSKLWNILAKVLSRRSHQGIESNSYLLYVPSTGRQMVRSERNIRQVAGARTNPSGANPDLGTEGLASAVLRTGVSVPCRPSSILKCTAYPGEALWLSQTQPGVPASTGGDQRLSPTRPGLAPTKEGGAALTALAAAASPSSPNSRPHTPKDTAQRTRRVNLSPILSILDTEGFERFELEDIRLLERSGRDSSSKYETPTEMEAAQALKNKLE